MSGPTVMTRYGKVEGTWQDGVTVRRGINYAKLSLGPLRFRPPEPPDLWSDTRQATQFGPMASQGTGSDGLPISGDCLHLSIWSPAADDRSGAIYQTLPICYTTV